MSWGIINRYLGGLHLEITIRQRGYQTISNAILESARGA